MSDWYTQWEAHFNEEMAKQKELPEGLTVGKFFRIQVADGYAFYEVTKINKRTVRVKWRKDLSCDGYRDVVLGAGGSCNIELARTLIEGEEALAKLFAEQKEKQNV